MCRGDVDVVTLRAGLPGGVCGSDIRQHAKLQGRPQQWNCRRLIDRLLETKASPDSQSLSRSHTPRSPPGGRWVARRDVSVCVCVGGWVVGYAVKGVCRHWTQGSGCHSRSHVYMETAQFHTCTQTYISK